MEQIRRSFDEASRDEEHFPATIDPRIFHVRLIQEYFGNPAGKRVLDAGCGKGRFARILQESNSTTEICGLDISPEMLKFVPDGIRRVAGSITALPFPSEAFDFVYATESLEHAVEIEKAVSELCRVLKPGGRIVIIDKNIEHFGKLQTPAWEKWFDRKEVEAMLRRDCHDVSSRFVSYWEDVEPDGMFLAWMAQK
jgi:ubiquinone/menaquinone biosynthesis C-methylase UbiE